MPTKKTRKVSQSSEDTLASLIERCGNSFHFLQKMPIFKPDIVVRWMAGATLSGVEKLEHGPTPEEAVRKLLEKLEK